LLLVKNYKANQISQNMLAEAQNFGKLTANQSRPCIKWSNKPQPSRRIRIGLVSGDLRKHPVGYFVEGVLLALTSQNEASVDFIVYSSALQNDALTDRIKSCCQAWRSTVGLSDKNLALQIQNDGIDILIDLSGHTAHNRLPMFAWKPAPVQVTWLGYFATTGVTAIDYLIADLWTLPESQEVFFTEKIWRLPETRMCFTPPDVPVAVSPLPALSNGHVTFGCFNNLSKMNDEVVALWAKILKAIPQSRLFLKAKQLNLASIRAEVSARFAALGVDVSRLVLEGFEARTQYLTAYHQVDIGLDPFPFPGGTTSAESLWMGVPVLTLSGESFISRQGVGLLMNAGLPDWIASDADDYLARAVYHASDLQGLQTLRKALRQQVIDSPIYDAQRFAHHFESALRGMWIKWCSQQQGNTL
jgi:predicted O-linked N-acetylglucosamine transferase (SPINDLY family)